jgi:hypothetical protein
LVEGRTYKVGLSSFIASAYKFEHRDPGRALGTTTAALIAFLEGKPDLSLYRDIRRAVSVRIESPSSSTRRRPSGSDFRMLTSGTKSRRIVMESRSSGNPRGPARQVDSPLD